MTYNRNKALIEGLKEAGRLVVFAIPGILIQVITGDAALSASYGGTALTVLRAIDKYFHENPNIKASGLLPF